MNLQQLRYAVEIEETGSITHAAKNLFMGQPNLSRGIRELEKELDITIFRRTTKGVEPTRRGAEFLRYAHTILSQMDELESLYKTPEQENIELRVSAPGATDYALCFAQFIGGLSAQSKLDAHFRETDPIGVISDLASGESALGIVRFQTIYQAYFESLIADNRLLSKPLREFTMQVVVARQNPLAALEQVPFHLLSGGTEIIHTDFQSPPLAFEQIHPGAQLDSPRKQVRINDRAGQIDLLGRLPGAFLWAGPIPAEELSRHALVALPCGVGGVCRDLLVWRANSHFSDCEQALADAFLACAQQPSPVYSR